MLTPFSVFTVPDMVICACDAAARSMRSIKSAILVDMVYILLISFVFYIIAINNCAKMMPPTPLVFDGTKLIRNYQTSNLFFYFKCILYDM